MDRIDHPVSFCETLRMPWTRSRRIRRKNAGNRAVHFIAGLVRDPSPGCGQLTLLCANTMRKSGSVSMQGTSVQCNPHEVVSAG